jgi:undecaprenyl-diphosphatase
MNLFDLEIIHYVNSFAHRSWFIDRFVDFIGSSPLFKGGMIIPILWWLWFSKNKEDNAKEYVLTTILLSGIGLFIARAMALLLPFRLRPIHDPSVQFNFPYGVDEVSLEGWSSFPSDHAVLFFTLATGIFVLSKYLGSFAFVYSFIFICLPRIYLGLHSPTDIIVGILLGIGIGALVKCGSVRRLMTGRFLEWEREKPGAFYACFFIVNYQMVILFEPLREFAHRLLIVFR